MKLRDGVNSCRAKRDMVVDELEDLLELPAHEPEQEEAINALTRLTKTLTEHNDALMEAFSNHKVQRGEQEIVKKDKDEESMAEPPPESLPDTEGPHNPHMLEKGRRKGMMLLFGGSGLGGAIYIYIHTCCEVIIWAKFGHFRCYYLGQVGVIIWAKLFLAYENSGFKRFFAHTVIT